MEQSELALSCVGHYNVISHLYPNDLNVYLPLL